MPSSEANATCVRFCVIIVPHLIFKVNNKVTSTEVRLSYIVLPFRYLSQILIVYNDKDFFLTHITGS